MFSKIKVLLADDHVLIREGFKALLEKSDSITLEGVAENGKVLIEMVPELVPDVVLVDITMPLLGGLETIEQLAGQFPKTFFIVLSMHEEMEYVVRALRAGAKGYLLKDIGRVELERAVSIVFNGGKYFSPSIATMLAESLIQQPITEQNEITPREKEVLALVATGNSSKQIADKLKISVRTVESHRINMLKKYQVANTAELISKATQLKLID